ncbi:hypothetical protein PAHAL_5G002900 [Panicum hallii]|uniref:WRKY domain-containing protein n=1 Tax=Panicum hallii TaxID=206008 RepID=A0A2S3HMN9_9POAL|nr:probable WRKY transcription factor 41 [Panicum hallii]PAN26334.1 hypothetical protein PAHAL_5G002900 [Panicum hallii]
MAEEELHQVPPPLESVVWRSSGDLLGAADDGPRRRRESMVNKLISTVYSGPTISDIESALSLSFTGGGADQLADDDASMDNYTSASAGGVSTSPAVVLSPELNSSKVLMSKMENKYTLKMKTCGNGGLAEDGYKWRKYGQKSIKNSPNPRSYYRCTNPRCNAKKQVERATDEADTLLVTYEGLHLHYTYSHFLLQHHHQQSPPAPAAGGGSTTSSSKKPKLQPRGGPAPAPPPPPPIIDHDDDDAPAGDLDLQFLHGGGSSWQHAAAASPRRDDGRMLGVFPQQEAEGYYGCGFVDRQHNSNNNGGLLEDVVPLLVRRPCNSSSSTTTPTSSSSSSPPPPPPALSTTSPYIDMAILPNIF